MKNYLSGAMLVLAVFLVSPASVQAVYPTETAVPKKAALSDSQIQSVIALLESFGVDSKTMSKVKEALSGTTPKSVERPFCHSFHKDLTVGSKGDEVAALTQALSSSGIKTTGDASKFTENNAGDVVAFQARHGIRQTGYVGPLTRAKLNTLYGCADGEKPKPLAPKECPSIVIPACVGKAILGEDGCKIGWKCTSTDTSSVDTISEQVKCVFNGATTEQKCWGDVSVVSASGESKTMHYGCSGVGTCVAAVSGPKGTSPVIWGSSCSGSVGTKIDGNSEYANFSCGGGY